MKEKCLLFKKWENQLLSYVLCVVMITNFYVAFFCLPKKVCEIIIIMQHVMICGGFVRDG